MPLRNLSFKKMKVDQAYMIASWQYPPPYEVYSMDGSLEVIQELLDGNYYVAFDEKNRIVGYLCYGADARVPGGYSEGIYDDNTCVDIGIGLKPEKTGKGFGLEFFQQSLRFIQELKQNQCFRLVVTTFNKRAINVYRKAGFKPQKNFYSLVNGHPMEFICMENRAK